MTKPTKGEWIAAKKDDPKVTSNAFNILTSGVELVEADAPKDGKAAARKFEMIAYTGGAMNVGAFFHPIVIDLSGLDTGNGPRPILVDHESSIDGVLGQTEKVEVKGTDLLVAGKVFGESDRAKQVVALNDRGFKFQASIGARVLNREFVPEGSTATVNGRKFSGPVNIARKSVLGEVSFVILGADDQTSARIAANAAREVPMDFAKWVEARGFTLADLSDAQKTSLQAMYESEKKAQADIEAGKEQKVSDAGLDAVLRPAHEKQKRVQEIVNITAKALQDYPNQLPMIEALSKQAVQGDWDTSRYELELLRAMRPQASQTIHFGGDAQISQEVIEAGICLAGGLNKPEKHFKEPILEAAQKRWGRSGGLGIGETLMMFARRNGFDALNTKDPERLLKAAFAPQPLTFIASAPSTMSLPGILSNVANKFVRDAFNAVEQSWRSVTAMRSLRDFKEASIYSLTGDFKYKEIAPGGKLEHAAPGEEAYTNQLRSYGRMTGLDRRDIINDDLGVFLALSRRLGRGGGLKLNEVFWTKFLSEHTSGRTFFPTNASKGNYQAGATPGTNDSRMNIEGLTRAEALFFGQTDPDGNPLGAMPKKLIVPPALNATASVLMRSAEIRDNTASTQTATQNPHAGKFDVVMSAYLASSAMGGGYSAAAWYLIADPNDLPFIETGFLNGVESPVVESADADFNTLGIQLRAYHDFGVELQEYRAAVKMKGSA